MSAYIVTWTWAGERFLLDVNTKGLASVLGIVLAESGRQDVHMDQVEDAPAADPERQARIWARVKARSEEMPEVMR